MTLARSPLGRFSTLARVTSVKPAHAAMCMVSFPNRGPLSSYVGHQPPIYFGDSPLSWYLMARCGVPSMGVHFLDYSHDAQATLQQPEA